ncbi:MAG: ammonium transporter [Leptospiraceae bacterium]|nr:ammonium transporter [Leptospiraceae bacterium]
MVTRPGRFLTYITVLTLIIGAICVPTSLFADSGVAAFSHAEADILWVLIATALVLFMQAGFLMLETGMVRAKNTINVAFKNLFDFFVGVVAFFFVGYGIMFGTSFEGWIGSDAFLLRGVTAPDKLAFFLFQATFLGTAATIVSGAVAERMRFSAYMLISLFASIWIYPVFGHWAWGGGWLSEKGFIDFAGSTVVHSTGGWIALAAIIMLGPRRDKFDEKGRPRKITGHNLPAAALGTFILTFGWLGFNGGSTLAYTDKIPLILVNTIVAASGGAMAAMLFSWIRYRAPAVEDGINGILGGLVAITAGCHMVSPDIALIIGLVAGIIGAWFVSVLEKFFRLDDVVGAFTVHSLCGVWGTVALAFLGNSADFATVDGQQLDRMQQILVQLWGIGTNTLWAFGLALLFFWILKRISPLRVSAEEEDNGLNFSEHNARTNWLDLIRSMDSMARGEGDLSTRLEVEPATPEGAIAEVFNRIQQRMEDIILQINRSVDGMESASGQMNSVSLEINSTVEEQSAQLEEINALMELISKAVDGVADFTEKQKTLSTQVEGLVTRTGEQAGQLHQRIDQAAERASTGRQQASTGQKALMELSHGMQGIEQGAGQVLSIVQTLQKISEKLSLLSINASIEAARSGREGEGFAVVAGEISNLADFTAARTKEAQSHIGEMQKWVKAGSEGISNTNRAFQTIAFEVTHIDEELRQIRDISEQQSERGKRIPILMEELDSMAQSIGEDVKARAEQIAEIYHSVSELSDSLAAISGRTEDLQKTGQELHDTAKGLQKLTVRFRLGRSQELDFLPGPA